MSALVSNIGSPSTADFNIDYNLFVQVGVGTPVAVDMVSMYFQHPMQQLRQRITLALCHPK